MANERNCSQGLFGRSTKRAYRRGTADIIKLYEGLYDHPGPSLHTSMHSVTAAARLLIAVLAIVASAGAAAVDHLIVYGSLRPDDDSGMPWTKQFLQGMTHRKIHVLGSRLFVYQTYACVALEGASDGDFVVGYALSAAPGAPEGFFQQKRKVADQIEGYPQMYDRTAVTAVVADGSNEDGTEVRGFLYHRRECVRGQRLKSGDWLKRNEDLAHLARCVKADNVLVAAAADILGSYELLFQLLLSYRSTVIGVSWFFSEVAIAVLCSRARVDMLASILLPVLSMKWLLVLNDILHLESCWDVLKSVWICTACAAVAAQMHIDELLIAVEKARWSAAFRSAVKRLSVSHRCRLGLGLFYCALELGTGWWNDSMDDSVERIGYTRKTLLSLTMVCSLISLINIVASIGCPVCNSQLTYKVLQPALKGVMSSFLDPSKLVRAEMLYGVLHKMCAHNSSFAAICTILYIAARFSCKFVERRLLISESIVA